MSHIHTIQPHFPRSTSMVRVGRDARLLFIQPWLVADDAGRPCLNLEELAEELYPYGVDGVDYLRVVRWRKHQKIGRPTCCRPPAAPSEPRPPREAREAREEPHERPLASNSSGNARESVGDEEP